MKNLEAVSEAMTWLGTPYHHQGRVKGVGVDTENNFPTAVKTINSHNSKTEDAQSNGVHPDTSGYNQISDGLFPFMKAT